MTKQQYKSICLMNSLQEGGRTKLSKSWLEKVKNKTRRKLESVYEIIQ